MEEKNLIGYCGLYCGDCFSYQGRIADLAWDLRKELRQARFDKYASSLANVSFLAALKDYPQCYEVLGTMVRFRCKNTCRGGSGPPNCKMWQCCQKNSLEGCWECEEFETCQKLDFLKASHGDAHLKNLRTLNKKGVEVFLQGKKYF